MKACTLLAAACAILLAVSATAAPWPRFKVRLPGGAAERAESNLAATAAERESALAKLKREEAAAKSAKEREDGDQLLGFAVGCVNALVESSNDNSGLNNWSCESAGNPSFNREACCNSHYGLVKDCLLKRYAKSERSEAMLDNYQAYICSRLN